jgi:NADPH2 dehydrogenase
MKHPAPQFAFLVSQLREAYPRLAYLHVVEPRVSGGVDRKAFEGESNDFLRMIWNGPDNETNGSVYLSAGGYSLHDALRDAEEKGDLIAFGRIYIPNVSASYIRK